MYQVRSRYVSRLLVMAVPLLAMAWASYAHGLPQPPKHQAAPAPVRNSSTVNQASVNQTSVVYLPLIFTPPAVAPLQFAAELDSAGNPVNPGTTFAYGIEYLYVVTTVTGNVGSAWRIKWTLDNRYVPELDLEGAISAPRQQITDRICGLVQTAPSQCEALPRGSYRVDFFLDNQLYQTGTAVIR